MNKPSNYILPGIFLVMVTINLHAQDTNNLLWNIHKCAVALTYDDGLNVHLDKVIPVLDSLGFKATFYIPGNSATLNKRMAEWKTAASNGHELGNHTLFHPCAGSPAGREWVNPDYDLDHYTITRIMDEIRLANTLLKAIDGKDNRTFAYTCGDMDAGDVPFYELVKKEFVAARGVAYRLESRENIDLYNIGAFMVNGQSGEELIDLVNKAKDSNTLLVFLFHGVGGEHSLNVSLSEHKKLLNYLKANQKDIWVSPLVDISTYLKEESKRTDH
jgi:peptidoglycan/xylan/chitin deacetylase (PgdA/CDA1 family)